MGEKKKSVWVIRPLRVADVRLHMWMLSPLLIMVVGFLLA
jgi:hypothetical protein